MTDSILYYGVRSSSEIPPIQGRKVFESGPKVEEVRQALQELKCTFVGDGRAYVIIGPIDQMRLVASDALLKTLEDLSSSSKRFLVLWAWDEFKVPSTIQSRIPKEYIPSVFHEPNEEAQELLEAMENRDVAVLSELTQDPKIISDLILVLSRDGSYSPLWFEMRKRLQDKNFDHDDLFSLLLEFSLKLS